MKIINKIKETRFPIFVKMIPSMISEYWKFAKGNARCENSQNLNKQLSDILMLTHALEKGFSLPNLRKAFGYEKAQKLLNKINYFVQNNGFTDELIVPVSVLNFYVEYHKNNNIVSDNFIKISKNFESLLTSLPQNINYNNGGAFSKTKSEMLAIGKGDFKTLSQGRYSIRNFDKEPVSLSQIEEALSLATKSPSACNRQSYRVHIFSGEQKNQILNLQGGSKSFGGYVDKVLLITFDMNRYFIREIHLGYVDASLFAMSLIYGFTYLGIGSIPLTLGINKKNIDKIYDDFSIPENETLVLLIGIGNYVKEFKVSQSSRNKIKDFTTYHN